jgi:hypothetical protein
MTFCFAALRWPLRSFLFFPVLVLACGPSSTGPGPDDAGAESSPATDDGPSSDSPFDGGSDAAAIDAAPDSEGGVCVVHGPPDVACGGLTCSGATPVCCNDTGGASTCIAAAASCSGTPPYNFYASVCDDAADCPPGQVCCDGYNKGLGRDDGATCAPSCVGAVPPPYSFQRCAKDCECPSGACMNGACK